MINGIVQIDAKTLQWLEEKRLGDLLWGKNEAERRADSSFLS